MKIVNDDIMTPRHIAKRIIDQLPIEWFDAVLDGFKGDGAFYDQYPETLNKYWCEIKEGKDFFDWKMPASKCGFPFGFPACAVWIKRDYHGTIETELWTDL